MAASREPGQRPRESDSLVNPKLEFRLADEADAKSVSVLSKLVWLDTYALEGVDDLVASYVEDEFSTSEMRARIDENRTFVARCDRSRGDWPPRLGSTTRD